MRVTGKIFSLLFAVVLLFCLMLSFSSCLDNTQLSYEIDKSNKTCTITGIGEYKDKVLRIPEKIKNCTVVAISEGAFKDCESIERVIIPDTVIEIGKEAFMNCASLISINIPFGIKSIEYFTFADCKALEKINIPSSVESIDVGAFACCFNLYEVSIQEGLVTIGGSAFLGCTSLREITIPSSLKYFGITPFAYCYSLQNIYVDENNPYFESINGILYYKFNSIFGFYPPGKQDTSFHIPEGLSEIECGAFFTNDYLKEIYIPNSVMHIYSLIFAYSPNLTSVYYDGTVQEWLTIRKENLWDDETADYTIYCTNGQIAKDGKITFK